MFNTAILARGERRDQVVELKHKADVLAPAARQLGFARVREVMVAPHRGAGGGSIEAAQNVQQRCSVDLPLPEGPSNTTNSDA